MNETATDRRDLRRIQASCTAELQGRELFRRDDIVALTSRSVVDVSAVAL